MNSEIIRQRAQRARALNSALAELFPDAGIALNYRTPWELVVAVMLSAQCTDKKVNEVTAELFRQYPALYDYVQADHETFAQAIRPTGFYRNKARNILAAARVVYEQFDGEVPCTMEALLKLPGVARKSANVILGNACGTVEGIAVDTHVARFAQRFDLTDHTDPVKIEQDLMQLLPRSEWFDFTYRMIAYGRTIGPARGYDPGQDPLTRIYAPRE